MEFSESGGELGELFQLTSDVLHVSVSTLLKISDAVFKSGDGSVVRSGRWGVTTAQWRRWQRLRRPRIQCRRKLRHLLLRHRHIGLGENQV